MTGFRLLVVCLFVLIAGAPPAARAIPAVEVVQAGDDTLPVWLLRDSSLPIVSLQLTIRQAGSAYDPPEQEGLAYLTAAMLTEGAGTLPGEKFQEALDFYAISLSASAGRDDITIRLETLTEHLDKAIELLGMLLQRPHFEAAVLDRVRAEHLSGLKRLQERPGYVLARAFEAHAFAGHPYARPPEGTLQSIASLNSREMTDVMQAHLGKDRLILSAAGDVEANELKRLLSLHLGSIPLHASAKTIDKPAVMHFDDDVSPIIMDVPQTTVRLALPGIAREDKDFYAAFVLNHMLGGSGLSSRLGVALRQERGLTYGVSSDLEIRDLAQWISIDFTTKNDSVDEAVRVARQTLRALPDQLSEEELQRAKDYLTGAFPLQTDTNAELTSYLDSMQRYGLGQLYLERRNLSIQNVTLQQLRSVAKRLLSTDHILILTAGGTSHEHE